MFIGIGNEKSGTIEARVIIACAGVDQILLGVGADNK